MKKSNQSTKSISLNLNKEMVANLTNHELTKVAGGMPLPPTAKNCGI